MTNLRRANLCRPARALKQHSFHNGGASDMHYQMRDPTSETGSTMRERLIPPPSLEGRTIALLDIGKERSDEFLDYVEVLLQTVATRCVATRTVTDDAVGGLRIRGHRHRGDVVMKAWLIEVLARRAVCMTWQI